MNELKLRSGPLIQKKGMDGMLELEKDPVVRAVLIQGYAWGGSDDDVAQVLAEVGYDVKRRQLRMRLETLPGETEGRRGERQRQYIALLTAMPAVPPETMEKCGALVRKELLASKRTRMHLWCRLPDLRGIIAYLLREGVGHAEIARVVSKHMNTPEFIDRGHIKNITKRLATEGRTLLELVMDDTYPPLTEDDIERAAEPAKKARARASADFQRSVEFLNHKESHAFAAVLVGQLDVPLFAIPKLLAEAFGPSYAVSDGYFEYVVRETPGATKDERRTNYAKAQEDLIDDKEICAAMAERAGAAANRHLAQTKETRTENLTRTAKAEERLKEVRKRERFEPLQKLIAFIKARSSALPRDDEVLSGVLVRYTATPRNGRPAQTLRIEVLGDGKVFRELFSYVCSELRDLEGGFSTELGKALEAQHPAIQKPALERVIVSDFDNTYTFDFPKKVAKT